MYTHDDCMCKSKEMDMDMKKEMDMKMKMEYARAYILPQKYENLFSCKEGFLRGTIFKDLYKSYSEYKKNKCER